MHRISISFYSKIVHLLVVVVVLVDYLCGRREYNILVIKKLEHNSTFIGLLQLLHLFTKKVLTLGRTLP